MIMKFMEDIEPTAEDARKMADNDKEDGFLFLLSRY